MIETRFLIRTRSDLDAARSNLKSAVRKGDTAFDPIGGFVYEIPRALLLEEQLSGKWHVEHEDGRRWTEEELDGFVRAKCDGYTWGPTHGTSTFAVAVDGEPAIPKIIDSHGYRWNADGPDMVVVEGE